MEAGYDYLHGRLQRRLTNVTGMFLLVIGLLMLASGGAYYVYAANSKSNLEDMVSLATPRAVNSITGRTASSLDLFPGKAIAAESWNDLFSYEPLYYRQHRMLDGFTSIGGSGLEITDFQPATRIMIPSIGINSGISELALVDLGDSRHYESPNNTVGHIPKTGHADENQTSWFFGHTESPVSREGSVFFNLQKVPEKLRSGEDVFIITDHGDNQFLYRATSSQVVHQSDLTLDATPSSDINLVSSVPRFVYDHRLIISGELVALK